MPYKIVETKTGARPAIGQSDVPIQLWMSAGAWLAIIIVYFLAHRVRRISEYTVSDILEKRYNSTARLLGSITIIIAYLTIAGYQFRAGGRLLYILAGIISVVLGLVMVANPAVGALAVLNLIAAWAIVLGVSLIAFSLWVKKHSAA